jgi:valyl-tRNA synthetase
VLGEVPFTDVVIHSTVLAPDGRRMSKSLGTGIDPLDVIAQYGGDATRYGLLKMSSTQDVRFNYGFVEEGRKLANKLWNAARLVLTYCEGHGVEPGIRPATTAERWILARIDATRAEVDEHHENFRFAALTQALYRLTFDDFCDWYLEAIKPQLREADFDTLATSLGALERLLKLLHPVMPHVTEEIWTNLPSRASRLIVAPWPDPDERWVDDVDSLLRVQDAAAIFRRSQVLVQMATEERVIFDAVVKPERVKANGNAGLEIERLRKEVARSEKMLANDRFVTNAAPDVVEGEREKLARYQRELRALEQ